MATLGRIASAGLPKQPASPIKYTVLNEIKFTAAANLTKVTVSGGTNTGATATDSTAPTAPGQSSHVRITNAGTAGSGWSITPATPWDFTNSFLRFMIRVSAYTAVKNISVRMATSAAAYAAGNFLSYSAKAKSTDGTAGNWFVTNTWVHDAIDPTIAAVNGTGASKTSIGYIVFVLSDVSATAATFDLASIQQIQKSSTKAKIVICHDDSVETGGESIYTKLNAYGFPAFEATEWESLAGTTFLTEAEITKYRAANWQFGSHATSSAEHIAATDVQVADQARRNRIQALKRGLAAQAVDFAYWGSLAAAVALPIIQTFYRSGRWNTASLQWPDTLPPAEPHLIKALLGTTSTDTFTGTWQPYIQRAIDTQGLAIMVFHQDTATNSAYATEVDSMLTWLDQNRANIDVVTIASALASSL